MNRQRAERIRRAAILVASLDEALAERILAAPPPQEAAQVLDEAERLETIDPEEQQDVVAEFRRMSRRRPQRGRDGGVCFLRRRVGCSNERFAACIGGEPFGVGRRRRVRQRRRPRGGRIVERRATTDHRRDALAAGTRRGRRGVCRVAGRAAGRSARPPGEFADRRRGRGSGYRIAFAAADRATPPASRARRCGGGVCAADLGQDARNAAKRTAGPTRPVDVRRRHRHEDVPRSS